MFPSGGRRAAFLLQLLLGASKWPEAAGAKATASCQPWEAARCPVAAVVPLLSSRRKCEGCRSIYGSNDSDSIGIVIIIFTKDIMALPNSAKVQIAFVVS